MSKEIMYSHYGVRFDVLDDLVDGQLVSLDVLPFTDKRFNIGDITYDLENHCSFKVMMRLAFEPTSSCMYTLVDSESESHSSVYCDDDGLFKINWDWKAVYMLN